MAATVNVVEANGATPTWTAITTTRYCTADMYNPGLNYPCVVPASGYNYSYWKHHALEFSGSFEKISNIRWYGPGDVQSSWNLGTGGMLMVALRDSGDHGCSAASYAQAAGQPGETGYYFKDSTNGHPYYKDQSAGPGDADNYTSSDPLLIDSSEYTSAGRSKAVVTQVRLASDAVQGDKPNKTFTFRYDEI